MALNKDLRIEKSIAVYRCDKGQDETYLYMEMTDYEKGIPTRNYPAPVSFFEELVKTMEVESDGKFEFNIFDKHPEVQILGINTSRVKNKVVFYTPAESQTLLFSPSAKIKSGTYSVPALIWVADSKDNLSIYAVREKFEELNPNTRLCSAPFMNMSNGRVCLGSTPWPKSFDDSTIHLANLVKKGFYSSSFTHFGGTSTVSKTNWYKLMESLNGGKIPYPSEELIENGETIEDLL